MKFTVELEGTVYARQFGPVYPVLHDLCPGDAVSDINVMPGSSEKVLKISHLNVSFPLKFWYNHGTLHTPRVWRPAAVLKSSGNETPKHEPCPGQKCSSLLAVV